MLTRLDVDDDIVERVCWLIAHHHTYNEIEGKDYQILVEADLLVNMIKDDMKAEAIDKVRRQIFRTVTGTRFLDDLRPT